MRHLGRQPWGTLNSNNEQLLENEHRHSFKKFKGDYLEGRQGREKGMVNGARFVLV